MSHKQATKAPPQDGEDRPQADSEWGFQEKKRRRRSRDGKIGFLLILLLIGAFGFVVYNRVEDKQALLAQIRGAFQPSPAKVKPKPIDTPDQPAPQPAPTPTAPPEQPAPPPQSEPTPAPPPANPGESQAGHHHHHDHGHGHAHGHSHGNSSPLGESKLTSASSRSAPSPFQGASATPAPAPQPVAQGPQPKSQNPFADTSASTGPAPAPAQVAQNSSPPAPSPQQQDPFAPTDATHPPAPSPDQTAQNPWASGSGGGRFGGRFSGSNGFEFGGSPGRHRRIPASTTALRSDSDASPAPSPVDAATGAPADSNFASDQNAAPPPSSDWRQQEPAQISPQAPPPGDDFEDRRPAPRPEFEFGQSRRHGRFSGGDDRQNQFEPPAPAADSHHHHHVHSDRPVFDPSGSGEIYTVQPLDTFWSISKSVYGTPRYYKALAEYNEEVVGDPTMLMPGMKIRTPSADVLEQQFAHCIPAAPKPGRPIVKKPAGPPGLFVNGTGPPIYRVGKGDTLSEIAQAHLGRSSRWVQIFALNRETLANGDPNDLVVGTELIMPADATRVRLADGECER